VISSKSSALIIKSGSVFLLSQINANLIKCTSTLCYGGALAIFDSHGTIDNSSFTSNSCESNGGAIGIANLSGDTFITSTNITMNAAHSGYGGGISYITDLTASTLYINASKIMENSATCGGGIYLEI